MTDKICAPPYQDCFFRGSYHKERYSCSSSPRPSSTYKNGSPSSGTDSPRDGTGGMVEDGGEDGPAVNVAEIWVTDEEARRVLPFAT